MAIAHQTPRFGVFTLDLRTGELRKHDRRLKLSPQPARLLALLVERAGEVVTREEIRARIWPDDTFVDFDGGINSCIRQIRAALGDHSEEPAYLQTFPGVGYSFVADVETGSTGEPPRPPPRAHRLSLMLISLTLLLALRADRYEASLLDFREQEWVLVANFVNASGDASLDGFAEFSVAWELANASFVSVVGHERVRDALRLMKRPLDGVLDEELARQICLRDGEIQAFVTGRIDRVEQSYVLRASLIEPNTARAIAIIEIDAEKGELLSATRRVAREIRRSLGERLPPEGPHSPPLEKVSTPSLRALQHFSRGAQTIDPAGGFPERSDFNWELAAEHQRKAIREDPDFAMAHVYLAWSYNNLGDRDRAARHFRRAYELADEVTDRERDFILGGYYSQIEQNREKALLAYRVLLEKHPDHYWASNNALGFAVRLLSMEESVWFLERRANNVPQRLPAQIEAARCLVIFHQDFDRARPYFDRALALHQSGDGLPRDGLRIGTFYEYWLAVHEPLERWVAGDIDGARLVIDEAVAALATDRAPSAARRLGAGGVLLTLGLVSEAEARFRQVGPTGLREQALALAALARGDTLGFRRHREEAIAHLEDLEGPSFAGIFGHVFVCGDAGACDPRVTERWAAIDTPLAGKIIRREYYVQLAHGEEALANGDPRRAIALLEPPLAFLRSWGVSAYFLGMESLANAHLANDDARSALEVVEEAAWMHRARAHPFTAFFWMRMQMRLAFMYREQGRLREAQAIENELRSLLKLADRDHAIVRALERREGSLPLGSP